MRSSQAAMDLIVAEEVSSKATYIKKYQRPEWPGAQSGVTIGIGYDCGYSTPDKIRSDWGPHLPAEMISALVRVAGLTGATAKAKLAATRKIVSVPWDAAMDVFENNDMPKWEKIVLKAIPSAAKLNADCFGVIVSVAYNRGPSFSKAGDRYREMRAIKQHIDAGQYSKVPADLKSMARLWPTLPGLQGRRKREAALFQKGLDKMAAQKLGAVSEVDEGEDTGAGEMSARAAQETGDDRSDLNDIVTSLGNDEPDDSGADDANVSSAPSVSHAPPPSKAEIEAVKKRLAALGYNEFGMLNGDWGGRTVGTIAAFKLDRGLNGPAVIDDALRQELDSAEAEGWHRPIAEARKNATASDIQEVVPAVKQNWWQKFIAYIIGIPAAVGAFFKNLFGDDADPTSYFSVAKRFLGDIPGEVWFIGVVAIAGFILYKAITAQNEIVQAYREGKIS